MVTSTTMDPQIRLLLLEQLLASKGIDIDAELAGVAIGLDGSVVFGAVKPSGEGTGRGRASGAYGRFSGLYSHDNPTAPAEPAAAAAAPLRRQRHPTSSQP